MEQGRAGNGKVRHTARKARPVRTAEVPLSEKAASILWGSYKWIWDYEGTTVRLATGKGAGKL